MIICHRSFIIPPLHWKGERVYCFTSVRPFVKKFYGRHHELVNGYRVSVTQIRPDLHLLLMSFPSSDATSTGLDHGQHSGFATFD
jgi:hypothetical protein